jgi:uncharacterized membrane-anchored protein
MPSTTVQAQNSKQKLNFVKGPFKAPLGTVAQIDVPEGYVFLDGQSYRSLMKAEGEPTNGRELGLLEATNEHFSVVFEFSDIGYVKDDEKDNLDANAMLESIKRGTEAANEKRARAGHARIEVVGWEIPPKYDATTHNLEWAIKGSVEGQPLLNYNTRLLGRKGVMEVVLITTPEQLPGTLPTFRKLLNGFSFQTGQNYAEYRQGDRVAKIGLTALVVGGAAVGAAKLGMFAWLAVLLKKAWKLVVLAFAAVIGFFKKLFSRKQAGQGE